MNALAVGMLLLTSEAVSQSPGWLEANPQAAAKLLKEIQDDSWEVRRDGFLEFGKLSDPSSKTTRNTVFNLLDREHQQLKTWLRKEQPPPEAWSDPYYPKILEYIQRHYLPDLTAAEFQVLARANINPESGFSVLLSKHAGKNMAWIAATLETEESEYVRTNMRALAAEWLLSPHRSGGAEQTLAYEILRRGLTDKSPMAASYSKRALNRLARKEQP